jgi:hypothetical protein
MALAEKFNFAEQKRRFDDAFAWFQSLGVAVDNTRAAEYRRVLTEMAEEHARGEIDALTARRSFGHLVNAITQAAEFIDIHRGLAHMSETADLASRLRTFVGGCAILSDETAEANAPRNIGFELLVAATMARGGLPVHLGAAADISIPVKPRPFFVECKRPFRESKVQNRIRKGLNQLEGRYDTPDARGFLALSISRLVNDGSYVLRVPTNADIDPEIAKIVDRYIARYQRHWQSGRDRRTTAVLIELRTACHVEDISLLGVGRFYSFVMIAPQGSAEREEFETIADAFRSAASL